MSEAIYRVQRLKKTYNQRHVLDVESLEIYAGEVFAIVGPSGAGKSTLLRLLNFLESPSQGKISFKGSEFSATKEAPIEVRRQVTTVFQRPVLLNRSVWANVGYGLRLRCGGEDSKQIQTALEKVGLLQLARQPALTLSGGEAQRVALARALVLRPQALLLDEPTANLDPYNVGLIESTVAEMNRDQGMTVVLVTHNVFQARRLAKRAVLLLDGQVVEVAEVDKFFEDPSDPRTAAFVRGEMVY